MSQLSTIFKETETKLGVFYPKNFIVAIFRSFESAKSAFDALRRAGLKEDEGMAVPGSDVLDHLAEMRAETGIWGSLMTELSRLLGTEAAFLDRDIDAARRGAGFLVVHCETEADAEKIRKRLAGSEPIAMQWYWGGAIRSLI